jgi:hypothetical protein
MSRADTHRASLRAHARRRKTNEIEARKLNVELAELARAAKKAGLSVTEIAKLAGCHRATVHRVLVRYPGETGDPTSRQRAKGASTAPREKPPAGGPYPNLRPMAPDDPRRLEPGQSVLVTIAPKPRGGSAGAGRDDDPPPHRAREAAPKPTYNFCSHFDYGLLREGPPDSLNYEAWCEPEHGDPGLWHEIDFDPFSASMSPITESMAKKLIGKGDLYAPADEDRYWRETEANMLRSGFTKAEIERVRAAPGAGG